MNYNFPLQHQLLLNLCKAGELNPESQKQIQKLLSRSIDWGEFYHLSKTHGLIPLVYYNLKRMGKIELVAPEIRQKMQKYSRSTAIANLLHESKRNALLKSFNKAEITVMPIKGLIFSAMIYGQELPRTISDIDLLIRKEEVLKVDAMLKKLNFKPMYNLAVLKNWHKICSYNHYLKKDPNGQRNNIDIHWDFLNSDQSRPALLEKMWERTRPAEISGNKVLTLSLEDVLLFMSIKFIRDLTYKFSLRSACDISNLIRIYRDRLDWNYILSGCEKNKITSHLYFALYFAEKLFGADLPKEVVSLKPGAMKSWLFERLIKKRIFLKIPLSHNRPLYIINYFLPTILSISTPRDLIWLFKVLYKRAYYVILKRIHPAYFNQNPVIPK